MRGGDKEGQNKMQLIDERGEFDEHACESFLHDAANAHEWNKKYAVMSIMGPQSSGKSTLMNHAFGTSFREMDELSGRRQTTKGVWMAIAEQSDDNNNNTIVLDLKVPTVASEAKTTRRLRSKPRCSLWRPRTFS